MLQFDRIYSLDFLGYYPNYQKQRFAQLLRMTLPAPWELSRLRLWLFRIAHPASRDPPGLKFGSPEGTVAII